MALIRGTRLGPYEILSALGAGGMGEVYKARDTRLERTVAIKILPDAFGSDREFRERFDREAKAIASLTHPHICTLYDVGHQDGTAFLVMEHLEGQTLADRLTKGALPFDDALKVAIEISDALDRAHRAGIVHRDLKPGNIMLTKAGAKLLDFGLAKTSAPAAVAARSTVPTTPNLTAQGTILGTFQYMAPEQLEGKDADARSDLFAFGAVVYEMVTGRKAFEGTSHASLIAAILDRDPPGLSTLEPMTPASLDRLVRTCLTKDPDARWQTATDLARELKWIAEHADRTRPPHASRRAGRLAWVAMAVLVVIAAALAIPAARYFRQTIVEPAVTRFDVVTPPTDDPLSFALSPDGRQLIFVASTESVSRLWVRPLDQVTAHLLAGTDGARYPFWAPGGDAIGFFAEGKLKSIDVAGGVPHVLADAPSGRGGSWGSDGFIVFAPSVGGPLLRVPASGGPTVVAKSGRGYRWPQLLPDGRHMLFWSNAGDESSGLYLAQIDGSQTRRLLSASSGAAYASEGYLLLVDQGVLTARRFDPGRFELGNPITVASAVAENHSDHTGGISVSASGVLAHRAAAAVRRQLVWVDRHGTRVGILGPPDDNGPINPALSPDGRRVAVQRFTEGRAGTWMLDNTRETAIRFTFARDEMQTAPLWSPDGSRVLYSSSQGLGTAVGAADGFLGALYEKAASGSGTEHAVFASAQLKILTDWSPDGRVVLFNTFGEKTRADVWALPLVGDRKPFPVLQTPFDEGNGQFAPDGRWIVYDSNESGRFEVYVQPFPAVGGKWQISTAGGVTPRWSHDGREVFYIAPDGALMAVSVRVSPDGQAVEPVPATRLFRVPIVPSGGNRHQYAVAPDNQRFLVNITSDDAATAPITIVQNWTAALKK